MQFPELRRKKNFVASAGVKLFCFYIPRFLSVQTTTQRFRTRSVENVADVERRHLESTLASGNGSSLTPGSPWRGCPLQGRVPSFSREGGQETPGMFAILKHNVQNFRQNV